MTDAPTTPTDLALARLSEEELIYRRKKALKAVEEAKKRGEKSTELERVYQTFETEYNRRLKYHLQH